MISTCFCRTFNVLPHGSLRRIHLPNFCFGGSFPFIWGVETALCRGIASRVMPLRTGIDVHLMYLFGEPARERVVRPAQAGGSELTRCITIGVIGQFSMSVVAWLRQLEK